MAASTPTPTAPDSPEMMAGSPGSGRPSRRMPRAAYSSPQDTKAAAPLWRMGQLTVQGSPQHRPAIMLSRSPVTGVMVPALALR